jgi:hypothetical protein
MKTCHLIFSLFLLAGPCTWTGPAAWAASAAKSASKKTAPSKTATRKPAPKKTAVPKTRIPKTELPKEEAKTTTSATAGTTTTARALKPRETSLRTYFGALFWQESIDVTNATSKAKLITQSNGITGGLIYDIPFEGQRWSYSLGAFGGLGNLKGKGQGAITDSFGNQPWYSAGVAAGITYRTSAVSSLSFSIPATYRTIDWRINPGSSTDPERDGSFSAGFTGLYANHLTPNARILFGFTRQHMWNATQWTAAWEYRLN